MILVLTFEEKIFEKLKYYVQIPFRRNIKTYPKVANFQYHNRSIHEDGISTRFINDNSF